MEAILEQKEVVHKDGWNVAMSQRCDVGSTYIEVNKRKRRDVSTSRRQRELCLSIIKSKRGLEFKGGSEIEDVRTRARKSSQHQDFDLGEEPSFCIFIFSDKKTDVL